MGKLWLLKSGAVVTLAAIALGGIWLLLEMINGPRNYLPVIALMWCGMALLALQVLVYPPRRRRRM